MIPLRKIALLVCLGAGLACANEFTHTGNGWSATIGGDGLLRSIKVGNTEMLQNFASRSNACVIFSAATREFLPPFEKVERTTNGTIRAEAEKLKLEYILGPDELRIKFLSRVKDQEVFHMYLRPSTAVTQALDGETDTRNSPTNTWYFDMLKARWFAASGEVLTVDMPGSHWSRFPYTPEGVGCFGGTFYPRNDGVWVLRPEANPSPATALAFEVRGESQDFLPPGGKPATFPCAAENLGKTKLDCSYKVTVRTYADRKVAFEGTGKFEVDPGQTRAVPVVLNLKKPNVYRAELELLHDGKTLRRKEWNFCYDFANWRPATPKPGDFDEFWAITLKELAAVPVDLKRTLVSEDERSALYKLDYAVLNGERAFAWLRVPKGKGDAKLPARLELPPSGVNKLPPPPESFAVEMKLAIHGYDVDFSNLKWEPPYPWPGGRYHNFGLEKKETYFYRNVYMRCVRAVDVLASLPEVDPARIMVFGGSQGGGLSIITAGLNPKVAFCAPAIAGLCRLDWTVRDGAGSWPLSKDDVPPGQTLDQMLETLSYFDAANFTGRIRCPLMATVGWLDTTTAAGGQVAAYANADKSKLTLLCAPWGRHASDPRTVQIYYKSHNLFFEGKPIPLPKTWETISEAK